MENNKNEITEQMKKDSAFLLETYGNKKAVEAAAKKASILDFVSKDKNKRFMQGIFYEDGFAIATDGRVLIKQKTSYPAEYEGKIIDPTNGKEIEGQYPNYKKVFPKKEKLVDRSHRLAHISDYLAYATTAAAISPKDLTIPVQFGNTFVNGKHLQTALAFAREKGFNKVYQEDNYKLIDIPELDKNGKEVFKFYTYDESSDNEYRYKYHSFEELPDKVKNLITPMKNELKNEKKFFELNDGTVWWYGRVEKSVREPESDASKPLTRAIEFDSPDGSSILIMPMNGPETGEGVYIDSNGILKNYEESDSIKVKLLGKGDDFYKNVVKTLVKDTKYESSDIDTLYKKNFELALEKQNPAIFPKDKKDCLIYATTMTYADVLGQSFDKNNIVFENGQSVATWEQFVFNMYIERVKDFVKNPVKLFWNEHGAIDADYTIRKAKEDKIIKERELGFEELIQDEFGEVLKALEKEVPSVSEKTESSIEKGNPESKEKKYSFIVKDISEFGSDFEPVKNLSAEEAVRLFQKLNESDVSKDRFGIALSIPEDLVFGEWAEEGICIAVLNGEQKVDFGIFGETFITQLKEKNERSRTYIDAYKELYTAFENARKENSESYDVVHPDFLFAKENELFENIEVESKREESNNIDLTLKSLSEIGNTIKNNTAMILKSPSFGDVTFSTGVFGDLSKKNNGGYGINHIIEGRYTKDNLSEKDIASLLYLIKNTVENTEVEIDESKSRQNIVKDGVWVTLRKDFDGIKQNWIVTGFAENNENGEMTREAADAIKAVNAQYGYAPEHLFVSEQVGAVIASLRTIAQNILKSSDKERIESFKSIYKDTKLLQENKVMENKLSEKTEEQAAENKIKNIEINPAALEEILSVMEFTPEFTEDGKIKVYDQQRNEYLDNRSDLPSFDEDKWTFKSAAEIFERMDIYINDYYIHDMQEQLEGVGVEITGNETLSDLCKLYQSELEKGNDKLSIGELNLAMGIVHPATVILQDEVIKQEHSFLIKGEKYSFSAAERLLKEDIASIFEELDSGETEENLTLNGVKVYGNPEKDGKIKLLVEFDSKNPENKWSEDSVFNAIAEENITFNGMEVDVNPITPEKSGTIEEYLSRLERLGTVSEEEAIEKQAELIDSKEKEEIMEFSKEQNKNWVLDGASNGMLAKFISSDNVEDIDAFRIYAADKITGNADDRTYFPQMWILGYTFSKDNHLEITDSYTESLKLAKDEIEQYLDSPDCPYKYELITYNKDFKDAHISDFKKVFAADKDELISKAKMTVADKKSNKAFVYETKYTLFSQIKEKGHKYTLSKNEPANIDLNHPLIEEWIEGKYQKGYKSYDELKESVEKNVDTIIQKTISDLAKALSEKPLVPENKLNQEITSTVPFEILDNKENGRVNIKFNPSQNNPYFNDIIKELKANNWKFAPSIKQWFPLKVDGSFDFAQSLLEKYQAKLQEKVQEASKEDSFSDKSVNKPISNEKTDYNGLRFFDRNYNEAEDFMNYFNNNLSVLNTDKKITLEQSKTILNALNHNSFDILSSRKDRLALDENDKLIIFTKTGLEVLKKETDLNGLLQTAYQMAEKNLYEAKEEQSRFEVEPKKLNKDINGIFNNLFSSVVEESEKTLSGMKEIKDIYLSEKTVSVEETKEHNSDFEKQMEEKIIDFKKNHYPYVEILYTERSGVAYIPKGTVWSLKEADEQIPVLNEKFGDSYIKTDLELHFPEKTADGKEYTGEEVTYTLSIILGTGRKIEPLTDYIRMFCSYPEVLDIYEENWIKVYAPDVNEKVQKRIDNILKPLQDKLTKQYAKIKDELKDVVELDNRVHNNFIIEASESDASKKAVSDVQEKLGKSFNRYMNRALDEVFVVIDSINNAQFEAYAYHKVKNMMQDVKYGESRNANFDEHGYDFDFSLWRISLEKVMDASEYDSHIKEYRKNYLAEKKQIHDYTKSLKKSSSVKPLEAGNQIGNDTVIDVYTIANGVYQATLATETGNGGFNAGNYFVIDENIADKLTDEIKDLLVQKENRYVIDNKKYEPYILKVLIEKGLMPPRDDEFIEKLDEYISVHPLKYEKLKPVDYFNFEKKLQEIAEVDKEFNKTPFELGQQLITLVNENDRKKLKIWLRKQGCDSREHMAKVFASWLNNKEQKKDLSQKKDNGYPPRGDQ